MNSLHKKRQAFRKAIRSQSIQQLFSRKRIQLLQQLKRSVNPYHNSYQTNAPYFNQSNYHFNNFSNSAETYGYQQIKKYLSQMKQQISTKQQQKIFAYITKNNSYKSLQKLNLICNLINKKQFCLDSQVQHHYGWKRLIDQFLAFIHEGLHNKTDMIKIKQKNPNSIKEEETIIDKKEDELTIKNMYCYSLIKIWQLKPKYEYFFMFPKTYHIIYQKLTSTISLTLIAQLSYEKMLLPNYQFIHKILEVNVNQLTQVKFFRTLQILKNFIYYSKIDHIQTHPRQLIFQYLKWIKNQINILLSASNIQFMGYQNQQDKHGYQNQNFQVLREIQFQTRYCLIYLLFTTLNKLSQINDKQKEHLDRKQILMLNQQLLNQTQNHTTLKFLIQQGKAAFDSHHKNNIFRTLTFYVSFLQISKFGKSNEQNNIQAQLEQIERTFQGTQLNWFQSFN